MISVLAGDGISPIRSEKRIDKAKPLLRPKWVVDDLEAVKRALPGTLGRRIGFGQKATPSQVAGRWDLRALQDTCRRAMQGPVDQDIGTPA